MFQYFIAWYDILIGGRRPRPPPKDDYVFGTGPDSIVLKVSENHFGTDCAKFTLKIDGQSVGNVFTAHAIHGVSSNSVIIQGTWKGQHSVAVTFINDLYAGMPSQDRNLWIDAVYLNGVFYVGDIELLGNGTNTFKVGVPITNPDLDLSRYTVVWEEDFANGIGSLSRAWGNVDTSTPGSISLTSTAADNYLTNSGIMVPPVGDNAGFGYGLYLFDLIASPGDAAGPYACLWPATDTWPGPELDVMEVGPNFLAYSTIHWKADDGSNQYAVHNLDGVDPSKLHTYAMLWSADHISVYVDNKLMYTTTDQVPKSYADGGQNSCPGIGMQAGWATSQQHGDNVITISKIRYMT